MAEPRKAGSIIVTKPIKSIEQNEYFDYQILLLKRCESLPFGGTHSFPGGKIERQDIDYLKCKTAEFALKVNESHDIQHHLFKTAALRNVYEDTGLVYLSQEANHEACINELMELRKKAKDGVPTYRELAIPMRTVRDEEEIIELIRLVTPNIHRVRYDTQYFIMNCRDENMWNVPAILKDASQKLDHTNLTLDEEYNAMMWASPAKVMKLYLNKEINLSTNEILITNILMTFKRYSDVIGYLKTIQYNSINSFSDNILEKKCLTFPFNLTIAKPTNDQLLKKRGVTEIAYFEGDFDYPFLENLKSQKDGKWKTELKLLYSKVRNNQDSRQRFYLSNLKKVPWVPSEMDIFLTYEMPLKLLKGYQEIRAGIGYGSF